MFFVLYQSAKVLIFMRILSKRKTKEFYDSIQRQCHSREGGNLKTRILPLDKMNKIPAGVYIER